MTDLDDPRMWARLQYILDLAIKQLPDEDRQARIAHCQRTGRHGITMHVDADGLLDFQWGGRRLSLVTPTVFDDDAYMRPMHTEPVSELPEDPRELTDQ